MPSGERTPYGSRSWAPTAAQHRAAYRFASAYVHGRRVVEIGCGFGFGARMLSEEAVQVLAVDNSQEAIAAASKEPVPANVEFRLSNAIGLSADEIRCDVLVAFQVIEHFPAADGFLELARDATRPDGVCLVSTPNALLSVGDNPYHFREYTPSELQRVLVPHFPYVELFGVCGSQRALTYHGHRRRLVRSILAVDVFGLRRVLPKKATQRAADYMGAAVKRFLLRGQSSSRSDDWDREYGVEQGDLERALDLIAVCRHGDPH